MTALFLDLCVLVVLVCGVLLVQQRDWPWRWFSQARVLKMPERRRQP